MLKSLLIKQAFLLLITLSEVMRLCCFFLSMLHMLICDPKKLTEEECLYAMNSATHLDFLIYNKLNKVPILAIEVDGYDNHKDGTVQAGRDILKNSILGKYDIPLLDSRRTEAKRKKC